MVNIQEVIGEFRQAIQNLYGPRLKNVILYGSWARGEATEDSDIDLMLVLGDKCQPGVEIDRMIDAVQEINLKYGVLISIYPISEESYRCGNSPLLLNVRREGIVA